MAGRQRVQSLTAEKFIKSKGDLTILGDFTFGDAAVDTLILKGRVSTMTAAGAAIQIGSAYTYGEGFEYRWQVVDWTGKTTFNGMYLRSEAATVSAAGKSIRGTEVYGVCNNGHNDNREPLGNSYVRLRKGCFSSYYQQYVCWSVRTFLGC